MASIISVNLLCGDKQANLKIFGGGARCSNGTGSVVDKMQEFKALVRQSLELPSFACAPNSQERRPQSPMDKRILAVDKLC